MAKTPKEMQVAKRVRDVAKRTKKRLHNGGKISKISPAQIEVLELYTKEFLTPKKIAIRRQTTTQSVYRILGALRKKGQLTIHQKEVAKMGMTMQPTAAKKINIHCFGLM